jgi:hypothetical protein
MVGKIVRAVPTIDVLPSDFAHPTMQRIVWLSKK